MKTTISTFYILIILSAFFTSLHAQTSGIKPGDRVRVFSPTTSEKPVIGNITSVSTDGISVFRNDGYFYFPLTSIERLDVSIENKKRPLRGLVIGTLTLGTLAEGLTAFTDYTLQNSCY